MQTKKRIIDNGREHSWRDVSLPFTYQPVVHNYEMVNTQYVLIAVLSGILDPLPDQPALPSSMSTPHAPPLSEACKTREKVCNARLLLMA